MAQKGIGLSVFSDTDGSHRVVTETQGLPVTFEETNQELTALLLKSSTKTNSLLNELLIQLKIMNTYNSMAHNEELNESDL